MNANWEPDASLQALLAALVDGEPTSEQMAELNRRLHQDSQARAYYVRTMSLHARLHARHATLLPGEIELFAADAQSSLEAEEKFPRRYGPLDRLSHSVRQGTRRTYEFFARPTPLSLAVATLFLASLLGLMAVVAPPIYRVVRATAEWTAPPAPVIVAQITDSYDAEWAPNQTGRHRGAFLSAGQELDLYDGFVEVTFRDGASVLIDGPARLAVEQIERGEKQCSMARLERGKVTARVPPAAVGFTVTTPLVEVVDLGTEFGIEVASEVTDVVVFRGEVAARPSAAAIASQPLSITGGQAVRFERSQPLGRPIPPQPNQFVMFPPQIPPAEKDAFAAAVMADGPLAYWRLNEEDSQLALSRVGRPHGIYRGGVAQGELPRPGDVPTGSSARFDGVDDYIEVDHDVGLNGKDFTIEVWARLDAAPRDFASVVTSRSDRGSTAGYILYVTPQGDWQLWTASAQNWAQVAGPPATVGQWTHVVGTFQRIRTHSGSLVSGIGSLYINGKLVAQKDDMPYVPHRETVFPLRIGAGATEQNPPKYFFPGHIAEVAIYNNALLPEEIERHYAAAVGTISPR